MKKTQKLLTSLAIIFTGMMVSSFWITESEHWRFYLIVVLACVTLKSTLNE